jgi:hypothetical protein
MPRVGFEPKITVLEWAKTFHALDLVATAQPLWSAEYIIEGIS